MLNSDYPALKMAPKEFWGKNINNALRLCLLNNSKIPRKKFDVQVERLVDGNSQFSGQGLKDFIAAPYVKKYKKTAKHSVVFIFEGFKFTIIMPVLSKKERKHQVILDEGRKQFFAPHVEFFADDRLCHVVEQKDKKIANGNVSKKIFVRQ